MVCVLSEADGQTPTWLEPSSGRGVFLAALAEAGVEREHITAVDLDPTASEHDTHATTHRGTDFLEWAARQQGPSFDRVIGNPPFVAIHTLDEPLRTRAAHVPGLDGHAIGIGANLWYAFLLASVSLLKPGGSFGFILPAAAEFADFCRTGRDAITGHFGRVDLIRSHRSLFEGVEEGSVVLIAQGWKGSGARYRRHDVADLTGVIDLLRQLEKKKYGRCPPPRRPEVGQAVELREVLNLPLGGVTGDARYFVMSDARRQSLGLPEQAMRPVVSRAAQIHTASIDRQRWNELCRDGGRVWLFRPTQGSMTESAVQRYLNLSIEEGGCDRKGHKIKSRDPWFLTPMPPTPHVFISGMSTRGLWLSFNEYRNRGIAPGLNATNTLYTATFNKIMSLPQRYAWGLALLSSPVAKAVERRVRVYTGGLRKLEPGDIASLRVPQPPPIADARDRYHQAVEHLLAGRPDDCRRHADRALASGFEAADAECRGVSSGRSCVG